MLTEKTDRAWFSRLLRHPARKWSGSMGLFYYYYYYYYY